MKKYFVTAAAMGILNALAFYFFLKYSPEMVTPEIQRMGVYPSLTLCQFFFFFTTFAYLGEHKNPQDELLWSLVFCASSLSFGLKSLIPHLFNQLNTASGDLLTAANIFSLSFLLLVLALAIILTRAAIRREKARETSIGYKKNRRGETVRSLNGLDISLIFVFFLTTQLLVIWWIPNLI